MALKSWRNSATRTSITARLSRGIGSPAAGGAASMAMAVTMPWATRSSAARYTPA